MYVLSLWWKVALLGSQAKHPPPPALLSLKCDEPGILQTANTVGVPTVELPVSYGLSFSCSRPRLMAFPVYLQRRILNFVHQHRDEFPKGSLHRLVEATQDEPITDGWTRTLLQMIKLHCFSEQVHDPETPHEPVFNFSQSSQQMLSELFVALHPNDSPATAMEIEPQTHQGVSVEDTKTQAEEAENNVCQFDIMDVDAFFTEDEEEEAADAELSQPVSLSQRRPVFAASQRATVDTSLLTQRTAFLEHDLQVFWTIPLLFLIFRLRCSQLAEPRHAVVVVVDGTFCPAW